MNHSKAFWVVVSPRKHVKGLNSSAKPLGMTTHWNRPINTIHMSIHTTRFVGQTQLMNNSIQCCTYIVRYSFSYNQSRVTGYKVFRPAQQVQCTQCISFTGQCSSIIKGLCTWGVLELWDWEKKLVTEPLHLLESAYDWFKM